MAFLLLLLLTISPEIIIDGDIWFVDGCSHIIYYLLDIKETGKTKGLHEILETGLFHNEICDTKSMGKS